MTLEIFEHKRMVVSIRWLNGRADLTSAAIEWQSIARRWCVYGFTIWYGSIPIECCPSDRDFLSRLQDHVEDAYPGVACTLWCG